LIIALYALGDFSSLIIVFFSFFSMFFFSPWLLFFPFVLIALAEVFYSGKYILYFPILILFLWISQKYPLKKPIVFVLYTFFLSMIYHIFELNIYNVLVEYNFENQIDIVPLEIAFSLYILNIILYKLWNFKEIF